MNGALEHTLRAAVGPPPEVLPPHGDRPLVTLELPLALDRLVTRDRLRHFRRAAVLVPLLRREGELNVLLTKRADHLRAHGGQVSFPGGRFEEEDEHLFVTALREAHEEVGLPPASVEIIGTLDDYPTITKYLVTPVVGIVETPPEQLTADRGEVAEIFEIPLRHLLRAESFERRIFTREGMRLPFYQIRFDGRTVWGATAGMLWNLCNKVNGDDT